jgi:hypothetical protein
MLIERGFSIPSVFCLIESTSCLSMLKYIEIAVDLIVIPRSFSSCLVSVKRISPAFDDAMIPALDTRESVRVDLPWSTAIMHMILFKFFLSVF